MVSSLSLVRSPTERSRCTVVILTRTRGAHDERDGAAYLRILSIPSVGAWAPMAWVGTETELPAAAPGPLYRGSKARLATGGAASGRVWSQARDAIARVHH